MGGAVSQDADRLSTSWGLKGLKPCRLRSDKGCFAGCPPEYLRSGFPTAWWWWHRRRPLRAWPCKSVVQQGNAKSPIASIEGNTVHVFIVFLLESIEEDSRRNTLVTRFGKSQSALDVLLEPELLCLRHTCFYFWLRFGKLCSWEIAQILSQNHGDYVYMYVCMSIERLIDIKLSVCEPFPKDIVLHHLATRGQWFSMETQGGPPWPVWWHLNDIFK